MATTYMAKRMIITEVIPLHMAIAVPEAVGMEIIVACHGYKQSQARTNRKEHLKGCGIPYLTSVNEVLVE